jgi:CBS domain-containing protein
LGDIIWGQAGPRELLEVPLVNFHLHLQTEAANHAPLDSPLCVDPTTPIRAALDLMKEHLRGSVLVCRDDSLVGIFTERDALRLMARDGRLDDPIESVMSHPVALVTSDSMGTAIAKMSKGGYRRLPVVDADGRPQGVLKVTGILHYLVEHFPNVIYNLPPKPHHSTQHREGA